MGERGLSIRTGVTKQGWENAEFPILCETCLGDNPYVRMLKHPFGTQCKICTRPFTVFRWKAGTEGRFKNTIICQTCAKLKNTCQTCLFDLEYGLPVELRDKLLDDKKVYIPTNIACRDYFIDQFNQNLDTVQLPYDSIKDHPLLQKLKRNNPGFLFLFVGQYNRNKAYICSFFVKGQCTRGSECPYRHEMPDPEKQNEELNREQNIKNRYFGKNDELAKKLMDNLQDKKPEPPQSLTNKSLIIHNCESVDEKEIRDYFQKFGVLESVDKKQKIAFITFQNRKDAESAMNENYGKLVINKKLLGLNWKKESQQEDSSDSEEGLLIPGSSLKIQKRDLSRQKGQAPMVPPKDLETNLKSQHQFLMDVILKGNKMQYPSMDPNAMGGLKKQVKKEI